jgi:hypothetical protein
VSLFLLQFGVYWPGIAPPAAVRPRPLTARVTTRPYFLLYIQRFERKTLVMDKSVRSRVYQASVDTNLFRRTDSARLGGGFKARRRTKMLGPNVDDVNSFR